MVYLNGGGETAEDLETARPVPKNSTAVTWDAREDVSEFSTAADKYLKTWIHQMSNRQQREENL